MRKCWHTWICYALLLGTLRGDGRAGQEGGGHANTALVFHAKQLLALEEGDMPCALQLIGWLSMAHTIDAVTFCLCCDEPELIAMSI